MKVLISRLQLVSLSESSMQTGFVYLIGAGPGNPDLLTIRGLKAIQTADIILFDALLGEEYLEVLNDLLELVELPPYPTQEENHE